MLTVMGALALLSLLMLTINSMIVTQTTSNLESEATLNAISLAQSLIDEVMTKAYDDSMYIPNPPYSKTSPKRIWDTTGFTPASAMHPSATEAAQVPQPDHLMTNASYHSELYYSAIGDYSGYVREVITPVMGTFRLTVTVNYADESHPDQNTPTRSYFKKITVNVTHLNMSHPFSLTDVAVYRRFF